MKILSELGLGVRQTCRKASHQNRKRQSLLKLHHPNCNVTCAKVFIAEQVEFIDCTGNQVCLQFRNVTLPVYLHPTVKVIRDYEINLKAWKNGSILHKGKLHLIANHNVKIFTVKCAGKCSTTLSALFNLP